MGSISVSIIMPAYNCQRFISQAIESVLAQTYDDWELLIVDDNSNDSSFEIAQCYAAEDRRIKLHQLYSNSGAAAARNFAIDNSQGRYLAFLDCDDIWYPDLLESLLRFMRDNDYHFVYSSFDKINEYGEIFGRVGVPGKVSYFDLLKTCYISCLTGIYDTSYFGKVYMPTDNKREDFATWLRLLKSTDYAYGINDSLAQYRVYRTQSSANKIKMAKETWRLYRNVEKLNFFNAGYYFIHYAFRGLLRTKIPWLARLLGVLK